MPSAYTDWLDGDDPCTRLFHSIATRDGEAFFAALENARHHYTRAGYRTVVMGFAANLLPWPPDDTPGFVPRAATAPNVVEVGNRVSLELLEDPWRRPEWAGTLLRVDDVGGRYERVHRNRLRDFQRDLAAIVSGDAGTAALTSLAQASEIVVRKDIILGWFTAYEDDTTVRFSRQLNHGDVSTLLRAFERFAAESPRPPQALPVPLWGFRGVSSNAEQMLEMMTMLMKEQES